MADPRITKVLTCITMQQGPGEVVVALKIKCEPNLTVLEVSSAINEFESRLRAKQPEAIGLYESEGFTPIAGYGFYQGEPLSRCYGLRL